MRCKLSVSPGAGAASGQWQCSVGESDQCGESVEEDDAADARIYC